MPFHNSKTNIAKKDTRWQGPCYVSEPFKLDLDDYEFFVVSLFVGHKCAVYRKILHLAKKYHTCDPLE
jgi:hypothetical protein